MIEDEHVTQIQALLASAELQGSGFVRMPKEQARLLLNRSLEYLRLQTRLALLEEKLQSAELLARIQGNPTAPASVAANGAKQAVSDLLSSPLANAEPSSPLANAEQADPVVVKGQGAPRPVYAVAQRSGNPLQAHTFEMAHQIQRNADAQRLRDADSKLQLDTPLNTTKVDYVQLFHWALEEYELTNGRKFIGRDLTDHAVAIICHSVELGMVPQRAAALAGVPKRNWQNWVSKAHKNIEPYASLLAMLEIAEARTEARHVANWQRHSYSNWQASQSFLARRFRKEWGDKQLIELSPRDLREMTVEQLAEIAGDLAANEDDYNVIDVTSDE